MKQTYQVAGARDKSRTAASANVRRQGHDTHRTRYACAALRRCAVTPDGELVPINVTLHAAEESGFEVRDVESLREHYALTLRHWIRNLEAHHDDALKFVDEQTYRVWRLYMSGSAHGFTTGRLNLYQALLARPDAQGRSALPLTREDWYR